MLIGLQWIRADKLLSIGFTSEQLAFVFLFIGVLILYYMVKPFVHWFVTLQSTKMLSYVLASLLVMIGILVLSIQTSGETTIRLLKMTLQTLAAFGAGLFMIRIIGICIKKVTKKSV